MCGIKIPQQDFALKMQGGGGGLCVREGVFAGRYGILQEYSHRVVLGLSYSPDPSPAQSNLL